MKAIQALFFVVIAGFGFYGNHPSTALAAGGHDHGHGDHASPSKTVKAMIELETVPESIQAQSPATLVFFVKDKEGKPVQNLTVSHERLLHVMILSEDFSEFKHIHPEDFGPITPEMKQKARFTVQYAFPKAGRYLVAVDTAVKEEHISMQFFVDVDGEPAMGSIDKDLSREKTFGVYSVSLTPIPRTITAGKEASLGFHIKKNGESVTDLVQYLGAPMHVAIILSDLNSFMHAHGDLPGASGHHQPTGHIHGIAHDHFGPEIRANVVFPVKGLYQIFAEVKHQDKVIVMKFMVEVE